MKLGRMTGDSFQIQMREHQPAGSDIRGSQKEMFAHELVGDCTVSVLAGTHSLAAPSVCC